MKINIEVNNKTQSPVEDDFFVEVAKKTIEATGHDFLQDKEISISVALVSEEEMQELNKKYRQKDSVTDILSFFEYENIAEIKAVQEKEVFLGELILCYDDIRKYAETEGLELQKELTNVFSHGVLHLLGYGHGEEMFNIQEKICKE